MQLRPLTLLVAVLAVAPLTATPVAAQAEQSGTDWLNDCRERNSRERGRGDRSERACEVRTETFVPGAGALRVNTSPNGGVLVQASSGSDIRVEARIQAQASDMNRATEIARGVSVGRRGNTLQPEGPQTGKNESWSVVYVVRVPRSMDLDLNTINGPVSVEGVHGNITARTVNGPLALIDVGGDVNGRTTNGPLTVRLAGTRWDGAGLNAESSNGPLSLTIPSGYNAQLETGTVHGPLTSAVPLQVSSIGGRSSRIKTTLGSGGAALRVVTTNGPVTIRQR